MNICKRAFLYVTRKKGKSILLFCIIFVITALVLCCLASLDAEEKASAELRGTTGSSFTVERNLSAGGYSSGSGGAYSTQEFISSKMIDKITAIEGIEAYDASSSTILNFYDRNGKYYENINPVGYAGADSQYYTNTSINSEYSSLFLSQILSLVEGRHIEESDENVVLISNELAQKHSMKVGDIIYAVNDPDSSDPTAALEIIGTFEVNIDKTDEKNNYDMQSYYDYENYAFTDICAMETIVSNYIGERPSDGYTSVDFFVSDPDNLEFIIQEARNISEITWDNYIISVNNEVYSRVAGSMSDLSSLIRTLIGISVFISAVIIILILSMWVRSRTREAGILIAGGVSKTSIILQYMVETAMITVFSFSGACFFSALTAGKIGRLFGKNSENILLTSEHMLGVCISGSIILIAAVVISGIPIMRLKPKEILTKMS